MAFQSVRPTSSIGRKGPERRGAGLVRARVAHAPRQRELNARLSREASREPPLHHEARDAILRVALQVAGKKVWYVLLAKIHGGSSAGEKYELDVPDLGVTF